MSASGSFTADAPVVGEPERVDPARDYETWARSRRVVGLTPAYFEPERNDPPPYGNQLSPERGFARRSQRPSLDPDSDSGEGSPVWRVRKRSRGTFPDSSLARMRKVDADMHQYVLKACKAYNAQGSGDGLVYYFHPEYVDKLAKFVQKLIHGVAKHWSGNMWLVYNMFNSSLAGDTHAHDMQLDEMGETAMDSAARVAPRLMRDLGRMTWAEVSDELPLEARSVFFLVRENPMLAGHADQAYALAHLVHFMLMTVIHRSTHVTGELAYHPANSATSKHLMHRMLYSVLTEENMAMLMRNLAAKRAEIAAFAD